MKGFLIGFLSATYPGLILAWAILKLLSFTVSPIGSSMNMRISSIVPQLCNISECPCGISTLRHLVNPPGTLRALSTGIVPSLVLRPAKPLPPCCGLATMFLIGKSNCISLTALSKSLPGFMSCHTGSDKNQFNILAVGEPCQGDAIVIKPFTLLSGF